MNLQSESLRGCVSGRGEVSLCCSVEDKQKIQQVDKWKGYHRNVVIVQRHRHLGFSAGTQLSTRWTPITVSYSYAHSVTYIHQISDPIRRMLHVDEIVCALFASIWIPRDMPTSWPLDHKMALQQACKCIAGH
jgi:hypothetical protein